MKVHPGQLQPPPGEMAGNLPAKRSSARTGAHPVSSASVNTSWVHHTGLGMDHVSVLTEIIYGGSGIRVLIMLDVDHNVEISLHVFSVAVALWPHDIRKGPERRKNVNMFMPKANISI